MNYEKYSEVIIPPEADLKLPTNNNSRYFYNNKIKELVFDIKFVNTSDGKFNLKLAEPLIIDVEHDIFLDTFITFKFKPNTSLENKAFLLEIDQFNIQTKSATNFITPEQAETTENGNIITPAIPQKINNKINNKIFIPNERTDPNPDIHHAIHKAKKFNYVGTITPSKLMNITGKITNIGVKDEDDPPVKYDNPSDQETSRMIAEFKLVPRQ